MLNSRFLLCLFTGLALVNLAHAQSEKQISFFTAPSFYQDSHYEIAEISFGPRMQFSIIENVSLQTGLIYTYQYYNVNSGFIDSNNYTFGNGLSTGGFDERRERRVINHTKDHRSHILNIPVLIKTDLWRLGNRFNVYATAGFRAGLVLYYETVSKDFELGESSLNTQDTILSYASTTTEGMPDMLSTYGAVGGSYKLNNKLALNLEPYFTYPLFWRSREPRIAPLIYGLGLEVAYKI